MPIRAAAETQFNDLLGSALRILARAHHGEFELKKLEKEALAMAKADPSGSLEVRAHIAAAKGDDCLTDELFERAMTITDNLEGTVMRYLIVLGALGRAEDARALYDKYQNLIGSNPTALRAASNVFSGSGWFKATKDIDARLQKMGVEKPTDDGRTNLDTFDDKGVHAVEFTRPISFARKFLRSRNHGAIGTRMVVVPKEEGDSCIFFEFIVDGEPDVVAELEWDLFSMIGEYQFTVIDRCMLTIALVPKTEEEHDNLLN